MSDVGAWTCVLRTRLFGVLTLRLRPPPVAEVLAGGWGCFARRWPTHAFVTIAFSASAVTAIPVFAPRAATVLKTLLRIDHL